MKLLASLVIGFVFFAMYKLFTQPPIYAQNACIRAVAFNACMQEPNTAPETCEARALKQSLVYADTIKPECREEK